MTDLQTFNENKRRVKKKGHQNIIYTKSITFHKQIAFVIGIQEPNNLLN